MNISNASRAEFLTTVRYIERYLRPDDRILDIGAGAYSFYFARKGYSVSALEFAAANVQKIRENMREGDSINLNQGSALDSSRYPDDSFDIVLVFGSLYHLHSEADKDKCIAEARRVCKPDGRLFFTFITNDMIILTEFAYRPDYFENGDCDKKTFRRKNFPFVFHTVDAARNVLARNGLKPIHEVAADGASELMQAKINALNEVDFQQCIRYHAYICEKKEFLGMTNHLLFVCENDQERSRVV